MTFFDPSEEDVALLCAASFKDFHTKGFVHRSLAPPVDQHVRGPDHPALGAVCRRGAGRPADLYVGQEW